MTTTIDCSLIEDGAVVLPEELGVIVKEGKDCNIYTDISVLVLKCGKCKKGFDLGDSTKVHTLVVCKYTVKEEFVIPWDVNVLLVGKKAHKNLELITRRPPRNDKPKGEIAILNSLHKLP